MAHRARNGGLMRRALRRGADASGARRRRRRRGGERVCLVSRRARDRGASLPAELLARTHAADASRIADVSFLPAAVGIPRTGWFVGSWIAGNAAGIQKQFAEIHQLSRQLGRVLHHPAVAGLLNWMTNSLAVKMIFSPEEYVGLEFRRWPETPRVCSGGRASSRKVRKMSTTMVELMTSRLLDVREVFGRLDKKNAAISSSPESTKSRRAWRRISFPGRRARGVAPEHRLRSRSPRAVGGSRPRQATRQGARRGGARGDAEARS